MTKKFTFLLMALLALTSFRSWGQETILSESFDSNSLPSGWTMTGDGTGNWSISTYNNAGGSPNELKLDWSPQFNGIARFVSPTVNLAGFENVVVSFKHYLSNYSGSHILGVATSSDGGTTWNVGWSGTYSTSGYYSVSQEIATADMGQPAVQFCIYYQGNSYNINQWYFDDILITGTSSGSCPRPSGLTASIVKATSATITWNGSADSYKVVYGPAEGFNPDVIQPETVSETTYTVSNLTTDVTYSIAVKAVCSAEEESDWSQTYSFTPTCPTVNINQWNIETTAVTAYIPWSVEGYAESFSLAYGLANDFNLDDENTYTLVENITNAYYELSNLAAGTEYKCAVKALCDGNTEGNWSNVATFTPSCPAPYLNSYDGIDLTPTTATISWDSYQDFIENYTLAYGLAETFDLEDPSTYTSVNVIPEYSNASYTIQDLTTNVSYKCAVRSSCDGSTQSAWSNVLTFMPFIEAPHSLTVSNIMATSATASWEASEGAANYTVAYGLASAFNLNDPTTYQTTEPTSATSVEITGLTADQNYACAVKSTNAESIDSKWSNPVYFMPTAKQTLVANDGTNTSYCHAPFYGGAIMTGESSSQFIIPASELLQMSGSSVIGFDFSQYNVPYHESAGNWEIYLKEVANTTFTSDSFIEDNTMQLVYSGDLMISSYTLSITFQNSFDYEGGNLLVYFKQTQNATSWDIYTPWYGVETSGYTSVGYYNYNGNNYIQRFSFLPKTTITYIPMEKFAITLEQPEDEDEIGTIAADMTEAAQGKTVTLSFNPKQYDDHSYRVSSWNVKKTDDETVTVTVAADNTFEMPAYPVTVSAVIEEVTYYALTIDEEIEGGTIEADPTEHLEFGQQVELSASPAQHYRFVAWNITKVPSGDAFPVPALPNTTFNMPASALNVSATFEAYLPHTITLPEAVDEGYVTASQTEGLYCYDNVTLTVHPATHCSLQSIDIMTGETPVSYTQDGNNYYFSMPDGDVTVTATFVENAKYTVSLVYNEDGGSINVGSSTEFYAGDAVYVHFTIETGYILNSIEAEDSNQNAIAMTKYTDFYKFTMPEDNVTVTAEFVRGITVNDGNNTNEYVPFYGYYADDLTKSQFIIPASQIRDLQGGDINSMVFYLNHLGESYDNITDHHFDGTWDVYITEVDVNQTTLSGYETSEMTKVYSGNMDIVGLKMTVNFNVSSYSYRNGNLLIYFQQTINCSGYNYKRTFWYGVNQSNNTAYAGYGSHNHSARQFLPKITFIYEPGEPLPEYSITFHSNGVVSEPQTLTEGQSLPNPTNIPAGLTFAGWAAEDIETYYNEEQAEQIEYVTAARAEEHLYAVFSYSEAEATSKGAGTWIKVTDVNELANNDKVVFVYGNYIMCQRYSGYYNYSVESVYIENGVITNISDNAIEFTLVENGDNWKLQYSDNAETPNIGETTLAYTSYDLAPHNFYSYTYPDTWTAVNNANAVNFKETDCEYTRYIAYNSSQIKGNSNNPCQVYKASAPVVTKTYYMTEVLTNGSITADTEVKNIIVNGSITVDQFKTLTLADGGFFRNKTTANLVFNNGAQFYYNGNANATFKKPIDSYEDPTGNDGYYLIANPTDNTTVANLTNNNYDLYTFNPAQVLEWNNEKENNTLTSGKGYLYANSGFVTLEYAGNLRSAADDMTIDLTYYEGEETGHEFPGFNLVGNPFACNAYVYNNAGEDFSYYTIVGSEITATTGATIPCTGIFVEASEANQQVTFSTEAPEAPASLLSLTVSQNRGNAIDRAIVRFDGANDLHKFMMNPAHTNIRLAKHGEEFAALSTETEGEIPVSFKAEKDGSYTITVNTENVEAEYLHLIDNMTGMDTDLLNTSSYTFNASTSDYAYRFKLVFNVNMDEANGSNANSFAYISNGNLVIENIEGEATMQIVDMLGRVISTEIVSGSYNKALNLNAGLYIINLNGMTQKIVVK